MEAPKIAGVESTKKSKSAVHRFIKRKPIPQASIHRKLCSPSRRIQLMRLLDLQNLAEPSLTEFIGDDVPRYAILSHTWGADGEEVTFKHLAEGTPYC